jgi:C_GCAxxG_C_C family probable redox protein
MSATKVEQALNLFSRDYNCSQAVLSVFADEIGLSKDLALKIASGFGSGMRAGEVCGAVSGAIMVLGLKFGHFKEGDLETKRDMYKKVELFQDKFKEIHGSILCKSLLGYDVSNIHDREIIEKKGLFEKICPLMIEDALRILED